MIRGEKGRKAEEQMVQVVKEEWKRFKERMQQSGKQPGPKEKVVVLTRSNYELEKAAELLKSHGIRAAVKKNGSFYGNPAVRDFYMMISSFLFSEEPKEIFNYLLTPYAGEIDSMNLSDMELVKWRQRNPHSLSGSFPGADGLEILSSGAAAPAGIVRAERNDRERTAAGRCGSQKPGSASTVPGRFRKAYGAAAEPSGRRYGKLV